MKPTSHTSYSSSEPWAVAESKALYKMQTLLKRPVLIEGLKNEIRPALNIARTTSLAESYRMGEDGKTLEVDFSIRQRKSVGDNRKLLTTFIVLSILYFSFFLWIGKGHVPVGMVLGGLCVVGFPSWLLRKSYLATPAFCVLRIHAGQICLSAEGRSYEQPLSALRDIVVLSRGLYFVFDDVTHGLLTECHQYDELSYLYSVIAQTLKAQGHRVPAGLTAYNETRPDEPCRT